jgi:hypothetical protein
MARAAFVLALANGIAAVLLAMASAVHVPLTKFPSDWELDKVQSLVARSAQLSSSDAAALERSIGWVRANERASMGVLSSLRVVAVAGFLALAVASFVVALLVRWQLLRSGQGDRLIYGR